MAATTTTNTSNMASRCPFSISLTHTHKISNLATISIFQLLVAAFTALSYSSNLCFEPQVSLHFCNFYIYLNFVLLFFFTFIGNNKSLAKSPLASRRVALRLSKRATKAKISQRPHSETQTKIKDQKRCRHRTTHTHTLAQRKHF